MPDFKIKNRNNPSDPCSIVYSGHADPSAGILTPYFYSESRIAILKNGAHTLIRLWKIFSFLPISLENIFYFFVKFLS